LGTRAGKKATLVFKLGRQKAAGKGGGKKKKGARGGEHDFFAFTGVGGATAPRAISKTPQKRKQTPEKGHRARPPRGGAHPGRFRLTLQIFTKTFRFRIFFGSGGGVGKVFPQDNFRLFRQAFPK